MLPLPAFVDSVIQGLTLVLPVGESLHLGLAPTFLNWGFQRDPYHLAGHAGLVAALAIVLHRELWQVAQAPWQIMRGRPRAETRLLVNLLIPIALIGLAKAIRLDTRINNLVPSNYEYLIVANLVTAALMWFADRFGMAIRRIEHMAPTDGLTLGIVLLAVAISGTGLIPLAIVALRILGFERPDAARFAFLIAFFAFLGEVVTRSWLMFHISAMSFRLDYAINAAIAFLASLIAAYALLSWLKRHSFAPFAIYRFILAGVAGLVFVYIRYY